MKWIPTNAFYDSDIKERLIYVNVGILFRSPGDNF